jgi:hypothetical protein
MHLLRCMSPEVAHRDLASRIHVRNAPEADKPEPTRMTRLGHRRDVRNVRRGALSTFGNGTRGYNSICLDRLWWLITSALAAQQMFH